MQRPLERGILYRVYRREVVDSVRFQYNPTSLSQRYDVAWKFSDGPGQYIPAATFVGYQMGDQQIALFFYGREAKGIPAEYIEKLKARLRLFVSPGPPFGIDQPGFVSPGRAMLAMGGKTTSGVIRSVQFKDTMFDKQGRPVVFEAVLAFKPASNGFKQDAAELDLIRARADIG